LESGVGEDQGSRESFPQKATFDVSLKNPLVHGEKDDWSLIYHFEVARKPGLEVANDEHDLQDCFSVQRLTRITVEKTNGSDSGWFGDVSTEVCDLLLRLLVYVLLVHVAHLERYLTSN
jgi:hypothetical protein